jgi:uncharacterized protein (DUF433 family)
MPPTIDEQQATPIGVTDIGHLIRRDPGVRGGRPIIAGTGVSVRRIVGWYQLGLTPDEIAAEIPHAGLAEVYAALAYYHANRAEIDGDLDAEASPFGSSNTTAAQERT